MGETLTIGLIGCGRAAERLYLPAFATVEEATVVAVSDPNEEQRERVAAQFAKHTRRGRPCAKYKEPEGLLNDENVQAVIIATPPDTHVPLATLAVATDRPILIEKPLAPTLAEARRLQAAWRDYSTRPPIVVGYNRRRWQPVATLRQVVEGHPYLDDARVEMTMTSNVGAWSPICGVKDPLDDLGSHQFDLLLHLFRRPVETVRAKYDTEMAADVKLTIAGDIEATCHCAQRDISQEQITVELSGRRFQVRMGSDRLEPAQGSMRSLLDFKDRVIRRLTGRQSSLGPSYAAQLRHFVAASRGQEAPTPDIDDGLAVLAVVEAAKQSAAENGREITLS